jgi:ABC-type transport system involved in multi-copper enzyme maturation permease subunit
MAVSMNLPTRHWAPRWHAAQAIQARSSSSTVYGLGIYITLSMALAVAALIVHNTVRYVERNAVVSTRQPLFLPLALMVTVLSLYLALGAVVAVARERDRGTLQVLMFGPVDETSFVLGHFYAQLKVYFGLVLLTIVWLNVVSWLLHLAFSIEAILLLASSLTTAAAVVAFGLLIAVWGGRTRAALVYFILIVLLFIALQVGNDVASGIALSSNPSQNDPIFIVRNALVVITNVTQWFSPYSQFSQMMDDLLNRAVGSYLFHLGLTLAQGLVLLAVTVLILQRKGPRE